MIRQTPNFTVNHKNCPQIILVWDDDASISDVKAHDFAMESLEEIAKDSNKDGDATTAEHIIPCGNMVLMNEFRIFILQGKIPHENLVVVFENKKDVKFNENGRTMTWHEEMEVWDNQLDMLLA